MTLDVYNIIFFEIETLKEFFVFVFIANRAPVFANLAA
jgi:hypothetical protein